MIIESNENFPWKNADVLLVPVNKVRVDPQERVRKAFEDFNIQPRYLALKESVKEFGLRNPISLDKNMILIEGFYRFNIVLELGWKEIPAIISDLSKYEALKLELQENLCRIGFSEYDKYVGIAKFKRAYEKRYPEVRKGKYDRNSRSNNHHKSISAKLARMVPSQVEKQASFIDVCFSDFGIPRRSSFRYARIGEAILENKFDTKTIRKIDEGKITQHILLNILRKIENKKIINNKISKSQKALDQLPSESIRPSRPPQSGEDLETEVRKNILNDYLKAGTQTRKPQKQKTIDTEIKRDYHNSDTSKNEPVTPPHPSNNNQRLDEEKKTEQDIPQDVGENSVEECLFSFEILPWQPENMESRCISCEKATVRAIPYKQRVRITCKGCHKEDTLMLEGYANTILCDDDYLNGSRPALRNPYNERCSQSPRAKFLDRSLLT